MKTKYFLAGFALFGAINLSAYTYEVQPLVGKNFTESGSAVDDSTAYGIRINKYISPNSAIMFGYTRIDGADYNKNIIQKIIKSNRSCGVNPCASKTNSCKPTNGCETIKKDVNHEEDRYNACNYNKGGSGSTSQNTMGSTSKTKQSGLASSSQEGASSQSGEASQTGFGSQAGGSQQATSGSNGGSNAQANSASNSATGSASSNNATGSSASNNQQPHKPTKITKPANKLKPKIKDLGKATKKASTDIDRFYLNGLYNIDSGYDRLVPYVYAGFGYERVEHQYNDFKSQGFVDAGLGVKFALNDRFSILADAQGIKKFRDGDFDILASLGLGFFFGANNQVAPQTQSINIVPKKEPVRKITIVKIKPSKPVVENKPKKIVKRKRKISHKKRGEYYIQLAAAFKTDVAQGCHFTEEMDKEGIAYSVKYTKIGGKNASVLVTGPYSSRQEAKEELAKIRKISKDAFIRRFKK